MDASKVPEDLYEFSVARVEDMLEPDGPYSTSCAVSVFANVSDPYSKLPRDHPVCIVNPVVNTLPTAAELLPMKTVRVSTVYDGAVKVHVTWEYDVMFSDDAVIVPSWVAPL